MGSEQSNTGISKNEKRLMDNTFILAIGTICSKVIVLLMVPLYSRWMTTEDYGSFDLFYTYLSLLVPIVTLSCGEAAFRFLLDEKTSQGQKKLINTSGIVYICGAIISSIGSIIFFSFTNTSCLIPFIILMISDVLNSYVGFVLRGLQKLKHYAIMGIINVFFMTIFVTLFVRFLGMGLSGMMLGYAIGMLSSALYGSIFGKIWKYCSLNSIDKSTFSSMVKYSAPLIPNSISWWVTNGSDRFIINLFLGAAANGIYAMAYKMPSICTTLFSVFHLSWQENASLTIQDDSFAEYFNGIYNKLIKRAVSICAIVLSTNYIIFNFIIDTRYYEAYYHVPILVMSVLFSFMAQFIGGIFIAFKNTKVNAATAVLAACVNIVVHLALIRFVQLYAAAISTLVSYAVLLMVRLIISNKKVKLRVEWNSVPYLLVLTYFIAAQYINNGIMNHVNLGLSFILFFLINKDMISEYIGSFKRKFFKY